MQSIDSKILSRIYGRGKGCVITPGDFLDLGSRQAVDLALHRLAKKGTLRRLARGLYDYPRIDPVLGLLTPETGRRIDPGNWFTDKFTDKFTKDRRPDTRSAPARSIHDDRGTGRDPQHNETSSTEAN
mgnify:CR=1 FL=1